jgi:hypothetical protein
VVVRIKEELRMKKKHDKPAPVGLHRYLGPKLEQPSPVGHPLLRTLPITK